MFWSKVRSTRARCTRLGVDPKALISLLDRFVREGVVLANPLLNIMAFSSAHALYVARKYRKAFEAFVKAQNETNIRLTTKHRDLMDEICMHSAAMGDTIGFNGQLLQVEAADPHTAWLGLPASVIPTVPANQRPRPGGDAGRPARIFSSIADALEAAEDGDVVQLLPGTHVVSQVTLNITKRVIIEGIGSSAVDVQLDHRANHPVFNITRSCILRCFSIDMIGFCEAVAISADNTAVKPFLHHINVSCSGGDGLTVAGMAQPLLQDCTIQARHYGMKQYASSTTTAWHCHLSCCETALVVAGASQAFMEKCAIDHCREDGIVGLQQAQVHLSETSITDCQGPGLDLSDNASAWLKHTDIRNCCGGVWLWHNTCCEAVSSHISGNSSYAVLLDAQAFARGSATSIDGPCHISCPESPGTPDQPSPRNSAARFFAPVGARAAAAAQSSPLAADYLNDGNCGLLGSTADGSKPGNCDAGITMLPHQQLQVMQLTESEEHSDTEVVCFVAAGVSPFCAEKHAASRASTSAAAAAAAKVAPDCGDDRAGMSNNLYGDGSRELFELVQATMCVADAAAAAALFPSEQGAFACE